MSIIEKALRKVDKQKTPDPITKSDAASSPFKVIYFIAIILTAIICAAILIATIIMTRNAQKEPAPKEPVKPILHHKPISPRLILNGIIFGEGEPFAVINNFVMKKGDSIDGLTLSEIYQDRVKVLYKEKEFILNLTR